MNNRLFDVTLLRAFAVLSLVMWHCYCPYICWGTAESPLNGFYTNLFTNIIPDANMPLFTFLAGYLFCYLYEEKGKYREFKGFLKSKVHRLLIPYLVLGLLINCLEYGKHIIDYFYGIPNHLWYCLMLFYVYVVYWLIHSKLGKAWNMLFDFLSFCVVLYYGDGALGHRMLGGAFLPVYYYVYFHVGYYTFKYSKMIFSYKKTVFLFSIVIYLATITLQSSHLLIFKCLSYMIILLIMSNELHVRNFISRHNVLMSIIERISYYSFGIYVFHQWIIWNITRLPICANFMRPYMETYYVVFPLLFYIAIFLLALGITALSMRFKIGRYFLS